MIDIVGIEKNDRGRWCHVHDVCGDQLISRSKIRFRKETMILVLDGGTEEVVVMAYIVSDVTMTCKVGFLPCHLASHHADDYDGMYAQVIKVYSS
jgi:hypothetical protein